MQKRLLNALALGGMWLGACNMVTDSSSSAPRADGTYKGDFQVTTGYYGKGSNGLLTLLRSDFSGAVGFTIQGDKVITTPSAGEGTVIWDPVNKYMWVEFLSIVSSNESHCSRWKYSGILKQSDQFATGGGTISCEAPDSLFSSWTANWQVRRQ